MFSKIKISRLPSFPGVYFFLDKKRRVIYIGKATSIRSRVRSYFGKDILVTRGPLIEKMIGEAQDVKFQKTDSVLEALILEANLIKKHQPKYNTQEKDDKSFNYVVITKENFPRILIVRGKDLKYSLPAHTPQAYVAGPFPHSGQLKEALKIIRKIFPFLGEESRTAHSERFYHELGLAPKTETPEAKKEYQKTVRHIKLFFEGKKKYLVKELEMEMKAEAKNHNFEKASVLRNKIFSLKHIQDIALIKNQLPIQPTTNNKKFRIESFDVAHITGKFVVGAMVVIENGELKKSDYRKFKIRIRPGINDPATLKEIIKRRLKHQEWPLPDLISVDGGIIQKRAAETAVKEFGFKIPVASVVKDERHKPRQILGQQDLIEKHQRELLLANHEAHRFALKYHRILRGDGVD